MGKDYKKNVKLVISHVEGSSGNFLARLYANVDLEAQSILRTDTTMHPVVLATGDMQDLCRSLSVDYVDHRVVVTHVQDSKLLSELFPVAKLIHIYPYTHIGNVLYNISVKKLKATLPNLVDNHFLHIQEWFASIEARKPSAPVVDFWDLTDQHKVETMLGIKFDNSQQTFFNRYWESQLGYEFDLPTKPMSISQLIHYWKIENFFCDWAVAWTIFVYEKIHNLREETRTWTIGQTFKNWQDVESIESRYIDKQQQRNI